ncbi:hypothetical protein [Arthrobacter sp. MYb213]|uniref:hypothetical protein n=1 Tax=Arthrobacter sp. MYb213 TaxID=1848595 RepID=UPI000CFE30D8|nr:hypothetical protein [Arthrobacter sp. MYb213]PRB67586.1 hypothetical protein CQ011_16025 [Arthrobacter sp. MYb213]
MTIIDWEAVPVSEPPVGVVEVPRTSLGFHAIASILELGVPHALYRRPRRKSSEFSGDESYSLTNPYSDCWFIIPPASMPTEGFWQALGEAIPMRTAGPGPLNRRRGMYETLKVLYSNS